MHNGKISPAFVEGLACKQSSPSFVLQLPTGARNIRGSTAKIIVSNFQSACRVNLCNVFSWTWYLGLSNAKNCPMTLTSCIFWRIVQDITSRYRFCFRDDIANLKSLAPELVLGLSNNGDEERDLRLALASFSDYPVREAAWVYECLCTLDALLVTRAREDVAVLEKFSGRLDTTSSDSHKRVTIDEGTLMAACTDIAGRHFIYLRPYGPLHFLA